MKLTPSELRAREDAIFQALEHAQDDRTFFDRLYRDGVPAPEAYLAQRVRVLFVFREPNMRDEAHAHDMRDEVSDVRFRPLARDGTREDRSAKSWWNWKAGRSLTLLPQRLRKRRGPRRLPDLVRVDGTTRS